LLVSRKTRREASISIAKSFGESRGRLVKCIGCHKDFLPAELGETMCESCNNRYCVEESRDEGLEDIAIEDFRDQIEEDE
jgi:hypothetical protein